ncbi:MAG: ABC transporter ATP-binding protein [Burkholderiaceae bacterium]|nr:ABC transporter ATP-binding protein [Burkholderiaceae bacterium]
MGTIVLKGVTKTYPSTARDASDVTAVDNVDFAISDCDIVCLVGPSGCGKSTVLNMIAGFEQPTSGQITVGSTAVSGAGPDRMVVFQSPALFGWMTVYENVVFGPKKQGVPRSRYEADAQRFIDAVGLTEFASHYPYQLSGGMRQRVQIARALVNRPEVLLMDEPFGALDFQTRLLMQELLLKVWSEFRPTIMFITHDVDEAIFLGDRVYVMSRRPGRLKEQVDVPFPKPRSMSVLTDPAFIALKERVLQSIKDELGETA